MLCILISDRLNLTAANHVYILEPQWNPSVESQAIGRVCRLGQNKAVSVTRYLVRGSVEIVRVALFIGSMIPSLTSLVRKCTHNRFEKSSSQRSAFRLLRVL